MAATGAQLIEVALRRRRLDLRRALVALARAGLTQILVEGGGELAAGLLQEELVDELHWFSAPRLLGGDARPAVGALAARALAHTPRLEDVRVARLGDDVHVWGRVVGRRGARGATA